MATTRNEGGAGRTVIVTGGARGIGAATALACARQGWAVVVNWARSEAAANEVVERIRAAGGQASAIQGDVADDAQVIRLFDEVDRTMPPLYGLVNNAGVVDLPARVDDMTPQRVRRMFEVNVFGSFHCAREAVRRLSTRHGGAGGAIVNVSSVAARIGSPGLFVDYAASKAAIDTFTAGLAKELAAEGVRVNAVRPGIVDTELHASGGLPNRVADSAAMIPMGRAGRAEEIAESIVWLLSDASSYTTGSLLDVSGGR